ncbi:hypothetical protein [Marinobacter sp. LN3S78]|uniref:hypothetical protein n=1 Tax=Marinobacter sp. LN3S78 TaxID=3382300 RepID=UPI00387B0FE6
MNKKLFAVSVLVAGMGMSSMAMASPVCEAQKAAAPDLVGARDSDTAIEEVYSAIDENASSEASATVLKESVAQIYADENMGLDAASELILSNCESKLGA